jgi:hypothetical protein
VPVGICTQPGSLHCRLVIIFADAVWRAHSSLAHFISVREKQPVVTCLVLLILLAISFILILK